MEDDGVRVHDTRSAGKRVWTLIAALLVAIALYLFVRAREEPPAPAPGGPASSGVGAPAPEPVEPPRAPKPSGHPVQKPIETPERAEDEAVESDQPTFTIAPPGSEPTGMALFPPPGTSPLLVGIVVPEDFPLPEGYVRHHQVTDDGRELPAILMFHPDYAWVDEDGAPIEIPENLVVPPELAPEGLPIRMLEPPAGEGEPSRVP